MWNGPRRENKKLMHRQDDLHLYDAVSSQLSLSKYQKQLGRTAFDRIELNRFTAPGVDAKTVVFGVCVLVANSTVKNGTRYYPTKKKNNDDRFALVAESLGLSVSDQVSIVERLRGNLDI